jgi:phosphate transport system substrate-binding protein
MIRTHKFAPGMMAMLFTATVLLLGGCNSNSGSSPSNTGGGSTPTATTASAGGNTLTGAGGTFPQPIYARWFQEYGQQHNLQVNYQAIGSGGGIKDITNKAVDFGASDAPMTDAQVAAAAGIVHIPTVAGAVTLAYNLPGIPAHLHLTGPVIANIFLGKITKWNDPAITSLNPGMNLPATPIITAHRSDGSGTTNIFTTYLGDVSPEWNTSVGHGVSVKWPVGLGGKGNAGVAQLVKQNVGALGYVELAYVLTNNITYADVQNSSGKFIAPSVASTTTAMAGVPMPPDFRKVATNTSNPAGYPITGFTFILVYPNAKPQVKGLLQWCLTDGQKEAATLDYAPLPANIQKQAEAAVAKIQ